jgi:hypothetical protein
VAKALVDLQLEARGAEAVPTT